MASEVKTNKISPATVTTVTLGDASDLFQLPASAEIDIASGATLDVNGNIDFTGATITGLTTGKIGQVLQATKTDSFTTAATSFTDITDLSISITPVATTSKIFVMMSINANGQISASPGVLRLMRDSTPIAVADAAGSRSPVTSVVTAGSDAYATMAGVMNWLDSPSTTSAVVYKIQGFCITTTNTLHVNRFNTDTDAATVPRMVSTITVMEYLA